MLLHDNMESLFFKRIIILSKMVDPHILETDGGTIYCGMWHNLYTYKQRVTKLRLCEAKNLLHLLTTEH